MQSRRVPKFGCAARRIMPPRQSARTDAAGMRLQKARGFCRREAFRLPPRISTTLATLWIHENHLPIDDKVTVSRCIKNVRNGQLSPCHGSGNAFSNPQRAGLAFIGDDLTHDVLVDRALLLAIWAQALGSAPIRGAARGHIAVASPQVIAASASAMPARIIAGLISCNRAMPAKLVIMPLDWYLETSSRPQTQLRL